MLVLAPYVIGPLNWQRRLEIIAVSLIAAVLTYHLVENPVRRLSRSDGHWIRVGAALSCVVLAAAALATHNLPLRGTGTAATLVKSDLADPQTVARMQQAVSDGLNTTAVPRNLQPSLDQAARDLPMSSANGCLLGFNDVEQAACEFGDLNGTHTVVLFGDSHIEHWLPAVAEAATRLHWKVVAWTKAACSAARVTLYNPMPLT
jgi:hypothetical protein